MATARSLDSNGFAATVATAGVVPAATATGGAGGPPRLGSVERGASSDARRGTATKEAGGEGRPAVGMGEGGE